MSERLEDYNRKPLQTDERVLYENSDGKVLVTNRRVKLGAQSWFIETVQAVELVNNQYSLTERRLGDIYMSNGIALGGMLIMSGVLVGAYMQASQSFSTLLLLLAIILVVLGLGIILYNLTNPREEFKMRLKAKTSAGIYSWLEATYTWQHRASAEETVDAVQQAINSRMNSVDYRNT